MAMLWTRKVKWEPAKPLKRPNFIQSSELGHRKHFYPTYEQDPVDMFCLLGMEYQRIWAKERTAWEEKYYPIPTEQKKLVIRALKSKKNGLKKTHSPPFKMKKFQNVPARTDHKRPPRTAQAEQKGETMKQCTCDTDRHKQSDHSIVSKVHTPILSAKGEEDDLLVDTVNDKKLESDRCHDQISVAKSHKFNNLGEKDKWSHTDVEGEGRKASICCCDTQNLDAQSSVSK